MRRFFSLAALVLIALSTGCTTTRTEKEKDRIARGQDFAERAEKHFEQYARAMDERFAWEIQGFSGTERQWREIDLRIKNHLREALRLAETARATDPENTRAMELLGLIRFEEKAYDKAIEVLERAREIDSDYYLLYFVRARIHAIRAERKFKEGDRDAGEELLANAVDDMEEWIDRSPLKTKDLPDARANIRLWEKELGRDPRGPEDTDGRDFVAFQERAETNRKLYTKALAKKRMWKTNGIEPEQREWDINERKIRMNLEYLLLNAERASVMKPKNWRLLEELARFHYLARNYDRAIRAAEDAKAIYPKSIRLYQVRAYCRWEFTRAKVRKREYDEARVLLAGAVKDMTTWLKAGRNAGKPLREQRADLRKWRQTLKNLP